MFFSLAVSLWGAERLACHISPVKHLKRTSKRRSEMPVSWWVSRGHSCPSTTTVTDRKPRERPRWGELERSTPWCCLVKHDICWYGTDWPLEPLPCVIFMTFIKFIWFCIPSLVMLMNQWESLVQHQREKTLCLPTEVYNICKLSLSSAVGVQVKAASKYKFVFCAIWYHRFL